MFYLRNKGNIMNLASLKPSDKSIKKSKRIGRGNATGQGRTAGKGHKGYKSRSGSGVRLHFEGGQTPLMRRLKKRGFRAQNRWTEKPCQIINLSTLDNLKFKKIDKEILYKKGIISSASTPLKVLGNGEISLPVDVRADMFSKVAVEKIEKAGGKVIFV